MSKEMKKLMQTLVEQGATLRENRSATLVVPPDRTMQIVTVHHTESDHRALRNTVSRLRRSGFVIA